LRLKILKKLRTASLNSKFTGSYKKVHIWRENSARPLKFEIKFVIPLDNKF